MKRQQSAIRFAMLVSGLCLLLNFSCVAGQDSPMFSEDHPTSPPLTSSHKDCLSLPERTSEDMISVYVAKVQEKPGFACARVVNGTKLAVTFNSFLLQKHDGG